MRALPSSAPSTDAVCVRDRLLATLSDSHGLVERFFQALSAVHSSQANAVSTSRAEDLMKKLQLLQVELRKLVDELVEHQQLNQYIERLNADNAVHESKLSTLSTAFREGESTLQTKIDELKDDVEETRRSQQNPVSVDNVISYGSKIGSTIYAPVGWDPSQPLGNFLRPGPSHEMMHAGRLAAMSQKGTADNSAVR